MDKLCAELFPTEVYNSWAEVNLNELAKTAQSDMNEDVHWIDVLHKNLGVCNSWGGYLEHRDYLLRDCYNKDAGPDHFWHLGIDYNVPVYTCVYLPVDAELVYSEMDPDQDGGWGGKVIFKYKDLYLILGHLDCIVSELRQYEQGEFVGRVGNRSVNGGWFPHLHVQCMRKLDVKVDGYSHWYEGIKNDFPNPVEVVP